MKETTNNTSPEPRQLYIDVKGARVNNLKNIDLRIPRNRLIVITGLSGSGKSSLAFDTLYAEGRRRYVESLSAYARQFMGKLKKPDCDYIKGLPPAIAIEQKTVARNPRSTVGTSTEIYDYLRMLFGRIGRTYSPTTGLEVKKHNVEDVIAKALEYPDGTRIALAAPVTLPEGRTAAQQFEIFGKEGFSRLVSAEGEFFDLSEAQEVEKAAKLKHLPMLLVDRLAVNHEGDELSRLAESAETAFFEGHEELSLLVWDGGDKPAVFDFSKRFEENGVSFLEPDEQLFNFNNPYGACPACEGMSRSRGIDPDLVIPDHSLSVYQGAVAPWRSPSMSRWKDDFIANAAAVGFPVHRAYEKLTQEEKDYLWHGRNGSISIDRFFSWVDTQRMKIQYRVMLSRYMGYRECPVCHGTRLRPETAYIKVGGKNIGELTAMPAAKLLKWFEELSLGERDAKIAERLLKEIRSRLKFLCDVGLDYLTLLRPSNTLSGGESQRINLATSLGSSLVGSVYILDEPSVGLHPRDTDRLIHVLKRLRDIGNTVIVVEHDEEIMRAADMIVDVGPDAGRLGGEIVYTGAPDAIAGASRSHAMRYLSGEEQIPVPAPTMRRKWSSKITVRGAAEHNLKNIDVDFPLGVMTVVTGVSGSGKSTLVRDILYRGLSRELELSGDAPGRFAGFSGDVKRIENVEFVDQNPIGRSSRSNPATYLKAYDEIRQLFSEQPLARQMGFTPAYFSFNTEGGRCEECKGEGTITIEMQFMADVTMECEACHGKRFKPDILQVMYRDKNITDVLDLTVENAIEFFSQGTGNTEKRIVKRLQPLMDVGLGYIKLGQSSSSLSGGENQRVKLAYYLAIEQSAPTMFIFDEPTTGLHFHDIAVLLKSFDRLLAKGHTLVVIEHNPEVMKCADHIIDIGPEGGEAGGEIVATGTPELIVALGKGYTAKYLKGKLLSQSA